MLRLDHENLAALLEPKQLEQMQRDAMDKGSDPDDIKVEDLYPQLLDRRAAYSCKIRETARQQITEIENQLREEDLLLHMEFRAELIVLISKIRRTPRKFPVIANSIHVMDFECSDYTLFFVVHEKEVEILRIYGPGD